MTKKEELEPVSYTHLDVYKRQTFKASNVPSVAYTLILFFIKSLTAFEWSKVFVSYQASFY